MGNSSDIVKRIGYRLRFLRQNAGLSQAEVAERANLSRSFLTRIENGSVEASLSSLAQLAVALGVGMAQILGEAPIAEHPETAKLRLAESFVRQIEGVPVRNLGRVPIEASRWSAQGGNGGMINVPYDWTAGRDTNTLFVVVAGDDSLHDDGIPAGSFVLVDANDGVEPKPGDKVLVRTGGIVRLEVWPTLLGAVSSDRGGLAGNDGSDELFSVLGIVLVSWTQHKRS
jgi:transcriptional regulator with XRE-family HTH domain